MATTSSTSVPETGTGDQAPRQRRRVGFRQRLGRLDVKLSPYLYISPFFILFAVVGLFPLVYTAWVALHKWSLLGGEGPWVGLDNFQHVLNQPYFWIGLRNTVSIFLLSSVPQVILALIIAAVLDANLRARTFWRMGVLVPYVIAPVAVALIFRQIFADPTGWMNEVLGWFGLGPVRWGSQILPSHFAIATMVNYRWTGYNTLIFLAAMQAIPRDLYEAAIIDGASRVRQFFSVTIPMVRPTMIFVIITSTIGGLQIFDEPRMYSQTGDGGADRQWMTVTMYIYELGWRNQNFGRAAAVAWLLFVIILIVGLINFWFTRRIASDSTKAPKRKKVRA